MNGAPKPGALVPDAEYIRRRVPIIHVAEALGLKGDGRRFDCWRLYERSITGHKRQRTVGVRLKTNTLRCFACEEKKSLNPIDLVMSVRCCTVGEAVKWIDARFEGIPRVRLMSGKVRWGEVWPQFSLEAFIRSRAWSSLSHIAGKIAAWLLVEVPPTGEGSRIVSLTYPRITAMCGVPDKRASHNALADLESIGFLSWGSESTSGGWMARGPRRRTVLALTWDSSVFRTWLSGDDSHQLFSEVSHQSGEKTPRKTKSQGVQGDAREELQPLRQPAKSLPLPNAECRKSDWEAERRAELERQKVAILAAEANGKLENSSAKQPTPEMWSAGKPRSL